MTGTKWVGPIDPDHTADGTAYASSTTLTDVSPAPAKTIPGYTLRQGSEVEIDAWGQFSTTGTPTLLLGLYYGGIAGVALAASTAITTGSAAAAWPWMLRYRGQVRTATSTGSIVGMGVLYLGTSLTAFTVRPIPEVAASRTVTIDTTTAKTITAGAQWGTNSPSNTLTCNGISVRLVN